MKIFIGRHGQASFDATSDWARPLTDTGIAETEKLRDKYLPELKQVERVWASDLKRAQETASLYANTLHLTVDTKNFLSPDGEAQSGLKR